MAKVEASQLHHRRNVSRRDLKLLPKLFLSFSALALEIQHCTPEVVYVRLVVVVEQKPACILGSPIRIVGWQGRVKGSLPSQPDHLTPLRRIVFGKVWHSQ